MNAPLVTIITIVRNDRDGLERTRASIAEQCFMNREWIIIDGASTDGTADIVRELFLNNEARGVSESDRGIYDAMNKGIDYATGEYLLFLNAGDQLLNNKSLDTAISAIYRQNAPDVAFFASMMNFGSRQILRRVKSPRYIWHGQPALHQATFFRRTLHLKHRFSLNYRVCGDYDALARMSISGADMRSFVEVIGINTFVSNAASGRQKLRLSFEAFLIQRRVIRLSLFYIFLSVMRRLINSFAFKLLTKWRDFSS